MESSDTGTTSAHRHLAAFDATAKIVGNDKKHILARWGKRIYGGEIQPANPRVERGSERTCQPTQAIGSANALPISVRLRRDE
jgi:hypothetical protein